MDVTDTTHQSPKSKAPLVDEGERRRGAPRRSGSVKDFSEASDDASGPKDPLRRETPESPPRVVSCDGGREVYEKDLADGEDAADAPVGDNMTSVFLPKINYVTLMLNRETESSANMESLALKYLKVNACQLA